MSTHILSYMEKILEEMKPLQQQLCQKQEFLLQGEYSSDEMRTLRQTLALISRFEHLIEDAKGSESDNKQT